MDDIYATVLCSKTRRAVSDAFLSELREILPNIIRTECVFAQTDFYVDFQARNLSSMFLDLFEKGRISKNAAISPVEVAIFLSHENIFKNFIASKMSYAVIFEDDCVVNEFTTTNIKRVVEKLDTLNFSMLYLWNSNANNTAKYYKKYCEIPLINPHTQNDENVNIYTEGRAHTAGTVAYIITREFALYFLQNSFKIRVSIDQFIGSVLYRNPAVRGTIITLPMIRNNGLTSYIISNPGYENSLEDDTPCFICDNDRLKRLV